MPFSFSCETSLQKFGETGGRKQLSRHEEALKTMFWQQIGKSADFCGTPLEAGEALSHLVRRPGSEKLKPRSGETPHDGLSARRSCPAAARNFKP
jgi:hypothetical protein